MKKFLPLLSGCALFQNIVPADLETLLTCLSAQHRMYEKQEPILRAGDKVEQIGIVLNGQADILQNDFWGNQVLLSRLGPGDVFAESFVLASVPSMPMDVTAASETEVLFLGYGQMMATCQNTCTFHAQLIANLLSIVSRKNLELTQKLFHVTQKTTRQKLLSFLSAQAQKAGSAQFSIPYDRQTLANYLAVDRSAMSHELGNMQKEGLLTVNRNHFQLNAHQ